MPFSGYQDLNPEFAQRLQALIAASPYELVPYSGTRTVERQKVLFDQAVGKYGSVAAARKWVAPPGNSRHNHGFAVDLRLEGDKSLVNTPAAKWLRENAASFGLAVPLSNEDWHIEPIESRGVAARDLPKLQLQGRGSGGQRTAGRTAAASAVAPETANSVYRIAEAIKKLESNGSYTAKSKTSSASGAYQYIDKTWNNYGGYRTAAEAPPAVQDQRMYQDVLASLQRYGGDANKVAIAHFQGPAAAKSGRFITDANGTDVPQYLRTFQRNLGQLSNVKPPAQLQLSIGALGGAGRGAGGRTNVTVPLAAGANTSNPSAPGADGAGNYTALAPQPSVYGFQVPGIVAAPNTPSFNTPSTEDIYGFGSAFANAQPAVPSADALQAELQAARLAQLQQQLQGIDQLTANAQQGIQSGTTTAQGRIGQVRDDTTSALGAILQSYGYGDPTPAVVGEQAVTQGALTNFGSPSDYYTQLLAPQTDLARQAQAAGGQLIAGIGTGTAEAVNKGYLDGLSLIEATGLANASTAQQQASNAAQQQAAQQLFETQYQLGRDEYSAQVQRANNWAQTVLGGAGLIRGVVGDQNELIQQGFSNDLNSAQFIANQQNAQFDNSLGVANYQAGRDDAAFNRNITQQELALRQQDFQLKAFQAATEATNQGSMDFYKSLPTSARTTLLAQGITSEVWNAATPEQRSTWAVAAGQGQQYQTKQTTISAVTSARIEAGRAIQSNGGAAAIQPVVTSLLTGKAPAAAYSLDAVVGYMASEAEDKRLNPAQVTTALNTIANNQFPVAKGESNVTAQSRLAFKQQLESQYLLLLGQYKDGKKDARLTPEEMKVIQGQVDQVWRSEGRTSGVGGAPYIPGRQSPTGQVGPIPAVSAPSSVGQAGNPGLVPEVYTNANGFPAIRYVPAVR